MSRTHLESPQKERLAALLQASISNQLKIPKIGSQKTREKIEGLEGQFHMSRVAFYQTYLRGEMGDEEAAVEWAGDIARTVIIDASSAMIWHLISLEWQQRHTISTSARPLHQSGFPPPRIPFCLRFWQRSRGC